MFSEYICLYSKQEYFQAEVLFFSQQLAYILDLRMTTLTHRLKKHRLKKIKMAEREPAIFRRRQRIVSDENLFQN